MPIRYFDIIGVSLDFIGARLRHKGPERKMIDGAGLGISLALTIHSD
jgi:hypothetical protein